MAAIDIVPKMSTKFHGPKVGEADACPYVNSGQKAVIYRF